MSFILGKVSYSVANRILDKKDGDERSSSSLTITAVWVMVHPRLFSIYRLKAITKYAIDSNSISFDDGSIANEPAVVKVGKDRS